MSEPLLRLIPSDNQPIEACSPATRPRFSHLELQVGECLIFRWKNSLLGAVEMVPSLTATQQAEPIVRNTRTKRSRVTSACSSQLQGLSFCSWHIPDIFKYVTQNIVTLG